VKRIVMFYQLVLWPRGLLNAHLGFKNETLNNKKLVSGKG